MRWANYDLNNLNCKWMKFIFSLLQLAHDCMLRFHESAHLILKNVRLM